jgi:hypothetical protein
MAADTHGVPRTLAPHDHASLRARAARARQSARYLSSESDRQLVLAFASELEAEADSGGSKVLTHNGTHQI